MITGDQIVAHLVGDYVLQSHWMATQKTQRTFVALIHVITYSAGFWFLVPSIKAMAFIVISHFFIDRFRLARYVVLIKNCMAPPQHISNLLESYDALTGYPLGTPVWLSVWLTILADNTLHLLCNGLAITYL